MGSTANRGYGYPDASGYPNMFPAEQKATMDKVDADVAELLRKVAALEAVVSTDPNMIVVDGEEYRRTGRIRVSIDINRSLGGGLYYGIVAVPIGFKPPAGWCFAFFMGDAGGNNTWISRISNATRESPNVRVVSSESKTGVSGLISWTLIKYT